MENESLISVGIDIGTSTTQIIFSRLSMENTAGFFRVPHVSIVDKEVIYKSKAYFTPLENETTIDAAGVREIVSAEFEAAGFGREDIGTGAVIITGEAARKENAQAVLESMSGFAGDFVVSAAGPDMEAVIAGKGSGAWQFSLDNSVSVVNLDIGGGTTNFAFFDSGETVTVGCLDIGGRQIRVSSEGKILYISPSAALIARAAGVTLREGDRADVAALGRVCAKMAELLEQLLGIGEREPLLDEIQTAGSSDFVFKSPAKYICFSGGVADSVYGGEREAFRFGDIGELLGAAIREGKIFSGFRVLEPQETLHATVVGAGTYTASVSGSTVDYSPEVFPLFNIPVLKLDVREQEECFSGNGDGLCKKLEWFLAQSASERAVIAMKGEKNPSYDSLLLCAKALARASQALPTDSPLIIFTESDIAKALGAAVRGQLDEKRAVVALDSLRVESYNYVDMGKPLMDGLVVPVVVKTLIFG